MRKAHEAAKQFKSDFPGEQQIQQFTIAFGATPPPEAPGGIQGWVLLRTNEGGATEQELRIESSSVLFRTTKYSRWGELWERVSRYFAGLAPIYIDAAPLSAIGLNYTDKFVLDGSPSPEAVRSVLRTGSPYFCQTILDAEDLWHSHVGYFDKPDPETKRLVNVNIDYVDQANNERRTRAIKLVTSLTDLLNQHGFSPCKADASDVMTVMERHMQSLHDLNKELLASILSESMATRIALEYP